MSIRDTDLTLPSYGLIFEVRRDADDCSHLRVYC